MRQSPASSQLSTLVFPICVVLSLALVVLPAKSQVVGASISGTVTDTSGALIAHAHIKVTSVQTGVVRDAIADGSGFYNLPNLSAGTYNIEASAPGFQTLTQAGVLLTVGSQQVINMKMQIGRVSQHVEVQSQVAPTIDLSTSSVGNDVNSVTIRELPLNGRDWTQLATLEPSVSSMSSLQQAPASNGRGNRGYGTQMTISGGRPTQNSYRIDGISVNDQENSAPGSVLGVALGVDAIQEFSILTTNYSSEYGRTSGGVINAISRSGTNRLHGSAYEFIRNSAVDARNFFDGVKIPPFRRNQFGASAGGPLRRDRAFLFGDYEGLRQSLGLTQVDTVPSNDLRNGIYHNSNGTTTNITIDLKVAPFLGLWHAPNGSILSPGNTAKYSVSTQQILSEDFWASKFDLTISAKDSLAMSFQRDTSKSTQPDALNTLLAGFDTARYLGVIEETHTFNSQFINAARVGYNRAQSDNNYGDAAVNSLAKDPSLGAIPGFDAPQIKVPGLTTFNGGLSTITASHYHWNDFQFYDDAFLTLGVHAIKIGMAFEPMQEDYSQINAPGGQYTFNSLLGFLQNQPLQLTAQLPGTSSPRDLRQKIIGAYIQDDIRLRPNLTVNAGLRYEIATVPKEVQGKLASLKYLTEAQPETGKPLWANPTLKNFEPRIGFSWDPSARGKTSIRGGLGLYDVLPLTYEFAIIEVSTPPYAIVGSASHLAQGSFPAGNYSALAAPSANRVTYIDPHPKRNYVMMWNFNMQREVAPQLTVMLGYVGTRGVHQPFRADDVDTVLPVSSTPAGYLWPSPAGSGTKLNPAVGRIDNLSWVSNSFYHSGIAELTKSMAHGFQLQGSYTWSRSIDEGSGSTHGDPFANSLPAEFNFDRRLRRGLSDFNVSQNAVLDGIWMLPGLASHALASTIVSGWQIGGIVQLRSGLPFTPIMGGDPLGLEDYEPLDYPDRIYSGAGCGTPTNSGNINYLKLSCFAAPSPITRLGTGRRNSVIGPRLRDVDLSLVKNNPIERISQDFNIQLRYDLFNILNHANFNPPIDNSSLFDAKGNAVAGAGLIDSTATTARQMQLAVKFIW